MPSTWAMFFRQWMPASMVPKIDAMSTRDICPPCSMGITSQNYSGLKKSRENSLKTFCQQLVIRWSDTRTQPLSVINFPKFSHNIVFFFFQSSKDQEGIHSYPTFQGTTLNQELSVPIAALLYLFLMCKQIFLPVVCNSWLCNLLHCQGWSRGKRQKKYRNSYSYINSYSESNYSDCWAVSICDITG